MQNNYKIRAIAFDMDGVLIDSNSEIENFWKQWAIKESISFTDETAIKFIHGRTTNETIQELFRNSTENTKRNILESAFDFDLNMQPSLIAGAGSFLLNLFVGINKIALVTSSPSKRARKMLELHGIEKYLPYSVTGDDVKSGKPDPEPYLKAALKMHVSPDDCLVFEDSKNGILSALAAGMHVISVNNYNIKSDRIISVINDYTGLHIEHGKLYVDQKVIELTP